MAALYLDATLDVQGLAAMPYAFGAFFTIAAGCIGALLARVYWGSMPRWARVFLIRFSCALLLLLAIRMLTGWSWSWKLLRYATTWLAVGGYVFLILLITL